jgi:hypothetical protein
MKRSVALFIILMASLPAWCRVEPYWAPEKKDTLGLLSAKQSNRIRVAIRGAYNPHRLLSNPASSHMGECMEIRIENVTDSTLYLMLPCGTMLLSLDSSAQNMLVSETRYFTLAPRQKKYERINALCGELHKNAPDVYVNYEVGKLAAEPLLRLAHIIEANSAQNKSGQYAVWAVTDNATKNELGEDYELLQASQKLLTLAGITFNIMGKQAEDVTKAAIKNSAKPAIAGNVLTEPDKESLITTTDANGTDIPTSVDTALRYQAEKITVVGNRIDNSDNQASGNDASELIVYAIGAMLLGFGIYLLGKKATSRNA